MKSWMNRTLIVSMAMGLVNCGGVSFTPSSGQTAGVTAASTGGSTTTATPTGSDSTSSTPTAQSPPPAPSLPKMSFVGPPCQRGTACLIEFEMASPASETFSFNWQTNDSLYLQTPPAGETYGQPNVQYVPTSGTITFSPGDTLKQVYVQNINPENVTVIIGVLMTGCQYGGVPAACTEFFQ